MVVTELSADEKSAVVVEVSAGGKIGVLVAVETDVISDVVKEILTVAAKNEKLVEAIAKANESNIRIVKFVRFETGEGMAKKEGNFAEEVAKQMGM